MDTSNRGRAPGASPDAIHFSVEMRAPAGLSALQPHLGGCLLPLQLWVSGYNGKSILRTRVGSGDEVEWAMDSSDGDEMFAGGAVHAPEERARHLLGSLSECLRLAGVPHRLLADIARATGEETVGWEFRWTSGETGG